MPRHLCTAAAGPNPLGAPLLDFLAELAVANDRSWLRDNHDRYRACVTAPLLALLDVLWPVLQVVVPGADPRPSAKKRCVVRVHRDARFVGNRGPFRDHTGLRVTHRASSADRPGPGVQLELAPGGRSRLVVGLPRVAGVAYGQLVQAVADDPDRWRAALWLLERLGGRLVAGRGRRKVPVGIELADDWREALAGGGLAVAWPVADDTVADGDLVPFILERAVVAAPLLRLQCGALGLAVL